MPSLFQNRYVKYAAIVTGSIFALFITLIILWGITNTFSASTGLDGGYVQTPPFSNTRSSESIAIDDMMMKEMESSYYEPPIAPAPSPDGYTSGLETYETTRYAIGGLLKEFDAFCAALTELKTSPDIHFRTLNESTNNCRATFYVADAQIDNTLETLSGFKGVELTRDTSSVTRHKQNLESQISILQKQLARTESSLAAAEAQLARLNELFLTSNDVTELSAQVTNSLRYIDQLTQKKIGYISQLDSYYQQAADLQDRIDVTEFSVNVTRANPIYVGKFERQWDNALEDLKDTFHQTLINLTTIFGAFLLWMVQIVVYLIVLIIVLRGLWKFGQLLWRRW